MYPGVLAKKYADRPAFIMASTGETVTYKEFEVRANQLAHFFRGEGLKKAMKGLDMSDIPKEERLQERGW